MLSNRWVSFRNITVRLRFHKTVCVNLISPASNILRKNFFSHIFRVFLIIVKMLRYLRVSSLKKFQGTNTGNSCKMILVTTPFFTVFNTVNYCPACSFMRLFAAPCRFVCCASDNGQLSGDYYCLVCCECGTQRRMSPRTSVIYQPARNGFTDCFFRKTSEGATDADNEWRSIPRIVIFQLMVSEKKRTFRSHRRVAGSVVSAKSAVCRTICFHAPAAAFFALFQDPLAVNLFCIYRKLTVERLLWRVATGERWILTINYPPISHWMIKINSLGTPF